MKTPQSHVSVRLRVWKWLNRKLEYRKKAQPRDFTSRHQILRLSMGRIMVSWKRLMRKEREKGFFAWFPPHSTTRQWLNQPFILICTWESFSPRLDTIPEEKSLPHLQGVTCSRFFVPNGIHFYGGWGKIYWFANRIEQANYCHAETARGHIYRKDFPGWLVGLC